MEWFNPVFLPAPSVVAHDGWLLGKEGIILDSLLSSTQRIVAGFLIGTAAAIVVAVWMSRFAVVEYWLGPILNLLGPIPRLALVLCYIHYLARHRRVSEDHPHCMDHIRSYAGIHIGRFEIGSAGAHQIGAKFGRVTAPYFLQSDAAFIPSECACGRASEPGSRVLFLNRLGNDGARSGLGFIIVDARNFFKMSNMFVAIVLIGLEYSVLSFLLKRLERRVVRWRGDGIRSAVEK